MRLTEVQIQNTDKIRNYISKNLIDSQYIGCKSCRGTGLAGLYKNEEGGFGWMDIDDFCEVCSGIGYIEWESKDGIIVCSKCRGVGCDSCKNKGIVDWIQAAKYGVTDYFTKKKNKK